MDLAARIGVSLNRYPTHSPALIQRGITLDRAQLAQDAHQVAARLAAATNHPTRIGVRCANAIPSVSALLGVLISGHCAVVLPAHEAATGQPTSADPWDWLIVDLPSWSQGLPEDAAPALQLQSSGTTGPPHPVHLSQDQVLSALAASGQDRPPKHGLGTTIVAHPIAHVAGMTSLIGALLAGRTVVLLPRFSARSWARAVRTHHVRGAFLVPTGLADVLSHSIPSSDLASLAFVSTGAAACSPDLADRFQHTYGAPVLSTYGATEFFGAVAGWDLRLHRLWWRDKAGSAGRAYPGVELRVTDERGHTLRPGKEGLLQVRTDRTDAAQWFATKDIAMVDSDGFLWIRGRADEVIVRGGHKVHPERIESVLRQHPDVVEASAFGVPDQRLGAVPEAAVELRAGTKRAVLDELIGYCAPLTPHERPRHIHLASLPRTHTGKINRAEVREFVGRAPKRTGE